MKRLVLSALGAAAVGALLLSGCATPPPGAESDLPWNTPQNWEGSINVPGFSPDR
jgi:starvation-inducible outer membrane lipoprotein